MAFKKKPQGRHSESESGSDGVVDEANPPPPPLPARVGAEKICNGTNRTLSFSSKDIKDGGAGSQPPQQPPPPIPSRPSTATSSRSNSISGGGGGFAESKNIGPGAAQPSPVSSLLTRNPSTSNDSPSRNSILGSSSGIFGSSGLSGLSGDHRINPFDKNVNNNATATSSSSSSAFSGDQGGTTLDDLIKNRFAKTQGVQDEATGRYKPKLADAKAEPSFEELKNELFRKEEKRPSLSERKWSETDSVFSSSPKPLGSATSTSSGRDGDSGNKFSKFSRAGSSDAEIIFGSATTAPSVRPKYNYSVDSQSSFSSETDNIFSRKEEGRAFIKSLSVSSTDEREFSTDPRVKNFEGIQNAAFQDFDSSSSRLTQDSGIGGLRSTGSTSSGVSSSSFSPSYKWSTSSNKVEEDYDDLK